MFILKQKLKNEKSNTVQNIGIYFNWVSSLIYT